VLCEQLGGGGQDRRGHFFPAERCVSPLGC